MGRSIHEKCRENNETMLPEARARGLRWVVTKAGELKIEEAPAVLRAQAEARERRIEAERARFRRMQADPVRQGRDEAAPDAPAGWEE